MSFMFQAGDNPWINGVDVNAIGDSFGGQGFVVVWYSRGILEVVYGGKEGTKETTTIQYEATYKSGASNG